MKCPVTCLRLRCSWTTRDYLQCGGGRSPSLRHGRRPLATVRDVAAEDPHAHRSALMAGEPYKGARTVDGPGAQLKASLSLDRRLANPSGTAAEDLSHRSTMASRDVFPRPTFALTPPSDYKSPLQSKEASPGPASQALSDATPAPTFQPATLQLEASSERPVGPGRETSHNPTISRAEPVAFGSPGSAVYKQPTTATSTQLIRQPANNGEPTDPRPLFSRTEPTEAEITSTWRPSRLVEQQPAFPAPLPILSDSASLSETSFPRSAESRPALTAISRNLLWLPRATDLRSLPPSPNMTDSPSRGLHPPLKPVRLERESRQSSRAPDRQFSVVAAAASAPRGNVRQPTELARGKSSAAASLPADPATSQLRTTHRRFIGHRRETVGYARPDQSQQTRSADPLQWMASYLSPPAATPRNGVTWADRTAAVPGTRHQEPAAPSVKIHIGRIRIDGSAPSTPRPRFARPRPTLGLEQYIRNRRDGAS